MATNNLMVNNNPAILQLFEKKFAPIPTEEGNTLLLKLKGNKVQISIIDDETDETKMLSIKEILEDTPATALKYSYLFELDKIIMLLSNYTENVILPMIIDFLYEYKMIDESTFLEKLLLLSSKYPSVEYIISSLSSMSTDDINTIMTTDDTIGAFESFI